MEIYNLAWLRRILSGIVNFNSGQTDQVWNTENDQYLQLDDALTEAADFELNEARATASTEAFKVTHTLPEWAVDAVTYTLPDYIERNSLLELWDITESTSGTLLTIGTRYAGALIFWKSMRTLQWGNDGPPSAKTLEATYIMSAPRFRSPLQEPDFIEARFRHLLPWSAACLLSKKADQNPPGAWEDQAKKWRSSWYSSLTKGSPAHQNVPRIRRHNVRR